MSNPIAGWYPDPSGDQSKLRYWDGTSWTEHFAPAHGAAQAASGTPEESGAGGQDSGAGGPESSTGPTDHGVQPTEQFPAQAPGASQPAATQQFPAQTPGTGQPTEQFPAQTPGAAGPTAAYPAAQPYGHQPAYDQQAGEQGYGQQPYGQYPGSQQPYGQSPYAAQQGQGYGQQPAGAEGGGSGKGLVVGIVVAAVVLIAAAITAVVLLLGGDDEPEPRTAPTSTPTEEPTTDAPTQDSTPDATEEPTEAPPGAVSGGELELDATVAGSIAPGETWTGTLTVADATPVVFDVVAESGDLTLAVTGGAVDLDNDDRRQFMKSGSASSLDPALGAYLEPGEYQVAVSAYNSSAGASFTVTTTAVELVAPGDTISVQNGPDESWVAAIELPGRTNLVLDAVSSEGDAVLGVFTATGESDGADDSDEGAGSSRDPYLEIELPAGVHFVSLGDYWGEPLVSELTVTAQ